MISSIMDQIQEFFRDLLQGWVLSNLESMFSGVDSSVADAESQISATPASWNASVFSMVRNLSDTVIIPIAGLVISGVLCYELISAVMDKNNMQDMGSGFFFRYIGKACIAVMLVSYASDITLAIFDLGSSIVSSAAGVITGNASINVAATVQAAFSANLTSMGLAEIFALGLETMVLSLVMKAMGVCITIVVYSRMVEIYLYISVAPMPFATLGNKEWGSIGMNYVKALCALAFQGFFMMVCVGIYYGLITDVASMAVSGDLSLALWKICAFSILLVFTLFKTGSVSKSILNAH